MESNMETNPIAQNVGNNQIFLPKNSVPAMPQTGAGNNLNNPIDNLNQQQVASTLLNQTTTSTYYNLFGMEISKTTLYIAIVFLLFVCVYYYYNKNKSKASDETDKKKKKKKDKKAKDDSKSSSSDESD